MFFEQFGLGFEGHAVVDRVESAPEVEEAEELVAKRFGCGRVGLTSGEGGDDHDEEAI